MNDKAFIQQLDYEPSKQSARPISKLANKPVKGKTVHQDTDETKVIGILSVVILFFTVLTISSYADDQDTLMQNQLISEQAATSEASPAPILINTIITPANNTEEETLKI